MRAANLHLLLFWAPLWCSAATASSSTGWTTYTAPDFVVRTKQTSRELCDGDADISGYVDWDDNHMFFWAFESRNDPATDPVILWLTGGPGASSVAFGAMMELGPCVYSRAKNTTLYNPYAWNSNATVIFVDQPLDVGFSYGSRRVKTLRDSTDDLYAFLERLFTARPDWAARDFYIAGESYGGSYVPALGAHIQRRRTGALARLAASTSDYTLSDIKLRGIMVGNGLMNQAVQRRGFFEMGCEREGAFLNASQCEIAQKVGPRCELLEEACIQSGFDRSVCNLSDSVCQAGGWLLINQTPRSMYDVRINCESDPDRCEDPPSSLVRWLNSTEVRSELGVDPTAGCNPDSEQVAKDFAKSGEVGYPSHQWITEILDQGLRVLIYVGNKDWICNAPGMRYFVDSLSWQGHTAFRTAEYRPVHEPLAQAQASLATVFANEAEVEVELEGRRLWGYHKRYDQLSFMEIDQAGHLAPHDQPEVTLAMINYFIARIL